MQRIAHTLLLITCILALIAITYSFVQYFVHRDYLVFAIVPCNPVHESCFSGDGEITPLYYKEVQKPAYAIPACNVWKGECELLSCTPNELDCVETLCDASMGEECAVIENMESVEGIEDASE